MVFDNNWLWSMFPGAVQVIVAFVVPTLVAWTFVGGSGTVEYQA